MNTPKFETADAMTPRSAPAPIRWWLKLTSFSGITLPPFGVYILAEQMDNQRLIKYEQCHWAQYERMGASGSTLGNRSVKMNKYFFRSEF